MSGGLVSRWPGIWVAWYLGGLVKLDYSATWKTPHSTPVLRTRYPVPRPSSLRRQPRLQSPEFAVQLFPQTRQISRENHRSRMAGAFFRPGARRKTVRARAFKQERLAGRRIDLDYADQNGTKKHRESLSTASREVSRATNRRSLAASRVSSRSRDGDDVFLLTTPGFPPSVGRRQRPAWIIRVVVRRLGCFASP